MTAIEADQPQFSDVVDGPLFGYVRERRWEGIGFQPVARRLLLADVTGALQRLRMDRSGALPNAYLFVGPHGLGQEEAFLLSAATIQCELSVQGPSGDWYDADSMRVPCWSCTPCRLVQSGSHPDVLCFEPEGPEYVVGTVRDSIVAEAKFSPALGRHRLFLIREAERLNQAAANALLRTLEEPPARVTFVLAASPSPEALPATIVSRCRVVAFSPLARPRLRGLLQELGFDPKTAEAAAAASEGVVADAVAAAHTAPLLEFESEVAATLAPLLYDPGANPLEIAGMLAEHTQHALEGALGREVREGAGDAAVRRRARRLERSLLERVANSAEKLVLGAVLVSEGLRADRRLFASSSGGRQSEEVGVETEEVVAVIASVLSPKTLHYLARSVMRVAAECRSYLKFNPRTITWLDAFALRLQTAAFGRYVASCEASAARV